MAYRVGQRPLLLAVGLAVVLMVVGAAVTSPVGAQDNGEPVVEPARQITADENPARLHKAAMAVDPNDPTTIGIATGDVRNGNCGVHVSNDGGLSWASSDSVMPEDQPFCIHRNLGRALDVTFASNGTLYMGMSASSADTTPPHPDGPMDPVVARSPDQGQTHDTFTITESTVRDDYEHRDGETYEVVEHRKYASVAVDPNEPDQVYRGWRWTVRGADQGPVPGWGLGCPDECAPTRGRIAVSSDGGETWGDPVDLAEAAGLDDVFGVNYPEIVVDQNGTVYAFAQESQDRAVEDAPPPRLFMFTSSDGGDSWEASTVLDDVANYRQPSVAIDPNDDTLHLAWAQRGDDSENPSTIHTMRSSDGGETWTDPVDITDEDADREINQYLPGVSVAPSGRVDVAWYDYRNDPFYTGGDPGSMGTFTEERFWDVYYTYSTDGGDSWAPNIRVSDRLNDGEVGVSFNRQDIRGPIAVGSADYGALFAWSDSRAGGPEQDVEDVYFTRARFDADEAVAAGGGASSGMPGWMWGVFGAAIGLLIGGVLLLGAVRWTRRPAPATQS